LLRGRQRGECQAVCPETREERRTLEQTHPSPLGCCDPWRSRRPNALCTIRGETLRVGPVRAVGKLVIERSLVRTRIGQ
jgi:hypothetical protein